MKHRWLMLRSHLPWLLLMMGIDGLAVLLLWLADANAFRVLTATIVLSSALLFMVVLFISNHMEEKRVEAFREFLYNPDDLHEEKLVKTVSPAETDIIHLMGSVLREKQIACSRAAAGLLDYEEYVEAWAHEIKNPLSLLTMILDNRSDEMSAPVAFKLNYVRNQMQAYASQMLYYARLKGTQKDYLFEFVDINQCIDEVLEDYQPLLEEKRFCVHHQVINAMVYTDRRGIQFLLGQVISNAVKYSGSSPELTLTLSQSGEMDILRIRDNGTGVRSCDLPYIFEKGFTGSADEWRRKATGMGLYLSKKIADALNISLEARSEWGKGFEMVISFPRVK